MPHVGIKMKDYSDCRDHVVQMLEKDLFGPYSGQEEIIESDRAETPVSRYSVGILFPRETASDPLVEDDSGDESGIPVDAAEGRLALSNSRNPSCYGISFSCVPQATQFVVKINAGKYSFNVREDGSSCWERKPIIKEHVVDILREDKSTKYPVAEGLDLIVRFRSPDESGLLPITTSLVNSNLLSKGDEKVSAGSAKSESFSVELARRAFFQVSIRIEARGKEVFAERRTINVKNLDADTKATILLHRHAKTFAAGHGCSADWEDGKPERVSWVMTSFLPRYDLYPMMPPDDLGLPSFSIKNIVEVPSDALSVLLGTIPTAYEKWIQLKKKDVSSIPLEFRDVANDQIKECEMSLARIRHGIQMLADPQLVRAFKLAHRAMFHVFAVSEWQGRSYDKGGPKYDDSHAWRPFQIAFILQCLESVASQDSRYRDTADLLWFPTGGGKTEAYLGLTAFVFFLRRLRSIARGKDGGGTAVIMRYTLRLLTADQFARASLLACACETVRKKEMSQGAPVSVGLWVGSDATPNKFSRAKEALDYLHKGTRLPRGLSSPVKLQKCPWCGHALSPADYHAVQSKSAIVVQCPSVNCEFNSGLPVALIDDHVYSERPSLIIGTVDKFARIPWKAEAGDIFSTDGKYEPPELIIQDELHLISGPLGTLVGLYEPVVDELCSREGKRPKIIASTATIRNSASQIRALFNRKASQFPPPCLDSRDSFFAKEDRSKHPRKYIGVFTPGKSPMTAYIRTAADLLHAAFTFDVNEERKNLRDPYWTLMTYFNSLRELGGSLVRTRDDVADYLKFCSERDGMTPVFRSLEDIEELTSRRSSAELDDIRDRLFATYPDEDPIDVVLCSNMVSVGLDVQRLGIMLVNGQPKTTAEYIQATSRIGRRFPGLVVSVYNWTRSRDRSHYERFKSYHSRLYSEVEATSVTPFSSRSRDRAIHAVLIALARHKDRLLTNEDGAKMISQSKIAPVILRRLQERVQSIDPREMDGTIRQLEEILGHWQRLAAEWQELFYSKDDHNSLMIPWEKHMESHRGFATLNSMRNVDITAGIYLK